MFSVTAQGDRIMPYVKELLADTENDLKDIDISLCAPGSTCLITATAQVYILNNNKEWVLL